MSWGIALSESILAVQANATRGIVKTTTLNTYELEATDGLTHSKTAFAKLKADIKAKGMTEPIKIVKHNGINYVVNGHHRLRAAKELGIREVPVQEVKLPYAGYKTVDDLLYSNH